MSSNRVQLSVQDLNDIYTAINDADQVAVYQTCPWTTVVIETDFNGQHFEVAGWSKVSWPDSFRQSTGVKIARNDARLNLRRCLEDYARWELEHPMLEPIPDWEWITD